MPDPLDWLRDTVTPVHLEWGLFHGRHLSAPLLPQDVTQPVDPCSWHWNTSYELGSCTNDYPPLKKRLGNCQGQSHVLYKLKTHTWFLRAVTLTLMTLTLMPNVSLNTQQEDKYQKALPTIWLTFSLMEGINSQLISLFSLSKIYNPCLNSVLNKVSYHVPIPTDWLPKLEMYKNQIPIMAIFAHNALAWGTYARKVKWWNTEIKSHELHISFN